MDKSDINFIKSIQDIGTSKFTPETYKENIEWKKKHNKMNYTVTTLLTPICDRIPTDAGVFILEMDSIKNQIEGIGIIKNFPVRCEDHGVKIYDNDYYNSYIYHGRYHISRTKILEDEDNIKPLKYLENLVFKGSTHLKRGGNAMCFSLKKERIAASPPYEEFICENDEWIWKNKKKDIRRCSICHRKKNAAHKYFYDINKKCVLTPVFSYKKNRCDSCGEFKKGHICENVKKNPENIKIVKAFLRKLFIK
jgi:hypothetical protein